MRKLLTIAACLIVALIWQYSARPSNSLIASTSAAEVEIYTASYCGECKRAKAYLNAHDIAFDERDVEHDLTQRKEFYARGGKGVPLLFVKGEMMHGFNEQKFESLRNQ